MKRRILCLILILGLGLLLRMVFLDKSPFSVNWDEASLGFNAYSIMKTGKDEYGTKLPLSLRSFSDFKPALYSYLSIPFIYFGGLNQITVRVVSVIAGVASLAAFWAIFGLYESNYWYRLLTLLVMTFEPWSLHFSRVALETNLSAAIFDWGVYFLLKKRWLRGVSFLALSAYGYHSARVAGPLLLLMLAVYELLINRNKKYLRYPLIGVICLLPLFIINNSSQVLARFSGESFFKKFYPFAPNEIFANTAEDWLLRSPIYYMLGMMSGKVAALISPTNYSTNVYGWIRDSVQYIPEFNALGWLEAIFFAVGVLVFIKKIKEYKYLFLSMWLISAAAPVVATWNWFHLLRMLPGILAVEVLTGVGMIVFLKFLENKVGVIGRVGLILLLLWQAVFIVNNEYNFSVVKNHGSFQPGGFKEGVPLLMELLPRYKRVVIDSDHAQAYIFFLFYSSYDPRRIQEYAPLRLRDNNTGSFDFDKFIFRKVDFEKDSKEKGQILWMPSIINQDQVERIGAKPYFFKSPVDNYNSAMMVLVD